MGLYSQVVFPRLCDYLLDQPFVAEHRKRLLANAEGNILEVGFGTGLNLPHYPSGVRKITTVDPNVGMHRLAQRRIKETGVEVDQRLVSSERLPFESDSFDCAVSTFTLCSIAGVDRALSEIFRVLKPGGRLLFLEHGLNWLQMRLADGCRLDRNIKELVSANPFASIDCEEFYLKKTPKTHGSIYQGVATKP
jgi:ubiquinone/menaquinone biosynthesis C-methylase UbiE